MKCWDEAIIIVKYLSSSGDHCIIAKRYSFIPCSPASPFLVDTFRPVYKDRPTDVVDMLFDSIEEAIITVKMMFPETEIYTVKPGTNVGDKDWLLRRIRTNEPITELDFNDLMEKYRQRS